jgi:hypothetical protein
MKARPEWSLLTVESFSAFYKNAFLLDHKPDAKHDTLLGPEPFLVELDKTVEVFRGGQAA